MSTTVTEYVSGTPLTPTTEYYLYDEGARERGNVILDLADTDGAGGNAPAISKRYLWNDAVDQIFAQEDLTQGTSDTDRFAWLIQDRLQSVRDVLHRDGTVAARIEYSSFGEITGVVDGNGDPLSESPTRFTFTGQEWDADTELYWFSDGSRQGRMMSPRMMKFIQPDPAGLGPDRNPGRYVGNSPTNFTDPSGQDPSLATGNDGTKYQIRRDIRYVPYPDGKGELAYVEIDGKYYTSNTWRTVRVEQVIKGVVVSRCIEGRVWSDETLVPLTEAQVWAMSGVLPITNEHIKKALDSINDNLSTFDMNGFKSDLLRGEPFEEALAKHLAQAAINEILNKVGGKLDSRARKAITGKLDELAKSFGKMGTIDDSAKRQMQRACEDAKKKVAVRPGDREPFGDLKARKRKAGETESLDMDHRPSYYYSANSVLVKAAESARLVAGRRTGCRTIRENQAWTPPPFVA